MENLALYLCTFISCFVIVDIIWGFMNRKYQKKYRNRYVYFFIEAGMIVGMAMVNILNIAFLNLLFWFVGIGISVCFLYEENNKPFKRILECEAMLFCVAIFESLGVALGNWLLQILHIDIQSEKMLTCFDVIFSKVVLICIYYIFVEKLIKMKKAPFSKMQYLLNILILAYTLLNIFVIADNMNNRSGGVLLVVNLACIILGDIILLYFVRVVNERNYFRQEMQLLEKQAEMQYSYYVQQEQKYNKTVQILHDVNKHLKSIEQLYANGDATCGAEYAEQIGTMLQPLLPKKYTGNPILDILLTDKKTQMEEKDICFDVDIDNVNLDFVAAIDVTTIFGNLLDNAIEACEDVQADRKIIIKINSFHEMSAIRIENSCIPVKWKNGMPVSEKGKNRGIGLINVNRSIEKYDGDMKLKNENGTFVVEIFLNS